MTGAAPDGPGVRLFFALWPDAATRNALGQWAHKLYANLGGQRVPEARIHVTLFFLGEVAAAAAVTMQAIPAPDSGRFALEIDRVGWWRHNRIAWAAPSKSPPALGALVRCLGDWLREEGMQIEARPFAPHITLLRQAQPGTLPLIDQPIRWLVDEFVLIRSNLRGVDTRYEVIGRFPL